MRRSGWGSTPTILRQELKNAAAQRLESVRAPRAAALSELERTLLRALVMPEADSARILAAAELEANPAWYAGLGSAGLMDTLVHAPAPDNPMDVATDDQGRAMMAVALHDPSDESRDALVVQVRHSLMQLRRTFSERRQRELRGAIAAAERSGDEAMLGQLMQEKLRVDKALREL